MGANAIKSAGRHEVQEAPPHRDVGNIGAPDLVGSINDRMPQQVRPYLVLRVLLTCVGFLINRDQTHDAHQASHAMPATLMVIALLAVQATQVRTIPQKDTRDRCRAPSYLLAFVLWP